MKWLSCLSIVILLVSMFPVAVFASTNEVGNIAIKTGATSIASLNASDISEDITTINFKLDDNNWNLSISQNGTNSGPIFTSLYPTLKKCFTTSGSAIQWDTLVDSATYAITDDKTIEMTIPKQPYNIQVDQIVIFDPQTSLLRDMAIGVPATQPSFEINADFATISGTLVSGATQSDIISGGKTLIITLTGCKWADDATIAANKMLLLNGLVSSVNNSSTGQWQKVRTALGAVNNAIAVNTERTIMTITLPAVPNYDGYVSETITLGSLDGTLITDTSTPLTSYALKKLATIINNSFVISPDNASTSIKWETSPALTENKLTDSSVDTLVMTLSNNTWATDIASDAKKKALLAGFTTSTDSKAWDNVKAAILDFSPTPFALSNSDRTLTITIPATITSGYSISTNQTIEVSVISTVLTNNYPASPNPLSFTIDANPSVTISGTLTDGVTEMDILKGGETIVATLYNATWDPSVMTDLTKREKLIDYLLDSPGALPSTDISTIKAGAKYSLKNSSTVSITLPPVPGFQIASVVTITPCNFTTLAEDDFRALTSLPPSSSTLPPLDIASISPTFTIDKVSNQSATISGTVTTATESDIVTGGKTLLITLNNNAWAQDVVSDPTKFNPLISGITSTTTPSAFASLVPVNVERTSDKVLTITLPPMPLYALTDDQTISVSVPDEALAFHNLPPAGISAGSFTVKALTVALSGTAVTAPMDSKSVIAGGKTIIISLNNATWVSDVITDTVKRVNLLDCFGSIASTTNWTQIKSKITAENIKLSKSNVLTIMLPPVPNLIWDATPETIKFSLSGSTSSQLINESIATGKTLTALKVQIGQTPATAILTAPSMAVQDVVTGGKIITIELTDGSSWDPKLTTTSSKINALVSGFMADSDSTSWAIVQKALKSSTLITDNSYKLNSINTILTITLPPVPDYDPVKPHEISLAIPKSVLVPATAEVDATGTIQINLPATSSKGTLQLLIESGSFANYINTVPLKKIFLAVPTKYLTSVVTKQNAIGNTSVNSLDIYTHSNVTSVKVTINGTNYTSSSSSPSGNGLKFNIGFSTTIPATGSVLPVDGIISVMNGSTNLQTPVTLKIGGSKKYVLASTTDLSGRYSLYNLMNNSSLMKNILEKYYVPADITVETL